MRWRDGARFLSLDSYAGNASDPISLHKYLYAHANPIMGIDPSGESILSVLTNVGIRLGNLAIKVAPAAYIAFVRLGFIAFRAYQMIPAVLNGLLIGTVVVDVGFSMIDKLTQNKQVINETTVAPVRSNEVTAVTRGRMVERIAGANLRGSFKGIDDFRNGVATQIKSYNIEDSKELLRRIESDLRKLQEDTSKTIRGRAFDGTRHVITHRQIQARQLLVALPENTRTWRDTAFVQQLRVLSDQYKTAIRPTIVRFWRVRR